MALRGTLKDFGIADILQLIGHQAKSGVLCLRNGNQRVDIVFSGGGVVRAESATRDRRDLLGRMLVRAEVLSDEQVTRALELQKRTLKRLGQILVESGVVDRKTLATFTRLQTTETIYRLFFWTNGSYEFSQKEINVEQEFEPLRSENILMEGFRQLDEWPHIRRRVTGYGVTFERVKELDPLVPATPMGSDELDLDSVFVDGFTEQSLEGSLKNIGQNERLVFQLISPERDVQKIIDLSRLGEFDTCKALERLIDAGFLAASSSEHTRAPSGEATVGGISAPSSAHLFTAIARVIGVFGLSAGLVVFLYSVDTKWLDFVRPRQPWGYKDVSLQTQIDKNQRQKVERALEVYKAMNGNYPKNLNELVKTDLITDQDLHFPWQKIYSYQRVGKQYMLLRPLF
ncbi:MAG: DUF4388 domain-containing protein [Deltaproteobacteria bacterium]|nr:DUF4388 domain-containing protein [Deltaproteobacteria bacterium]